MKLPAYSSYREMQTAWTDRIPSHWTIKRVKFLAGIRYGLGEPPERVDDGGIAFIRATDINRGRINPEKIQYVDPNDVPWQRNPTLRAGDILVVRSGAYTGDSAIIAPELDGSIAGYDMVVSSYDNIFPSFLAYAMISKYVLDGQIYLAKTRAAQPHLNAEELGSIDVVVPPYSEQIVIVDFLSQRIAEIDVLIDKRQNHLCLLEEKRVEIISFRCVHGVSGWSGTKVTGLPWLSTVPSDWRMKKIKHMVARIVDCLHTTPKYEGEIRYPTIRTADVSPGVLHLEKAQLVSDAEYKVRISRMKPEPYDILYSREGERFGMAALVPEGAELCLGQRMMMFRAMPEHSPAYIMWCLNSRPILDQVKLSTGGATSPHINIADIKNFDLPCPPKEEQEKIANCLNAEVRHIDITISTLKKEILILQEYRAALITAAVTGQIDVRGVGAAEAA